MNAAQTILVIDDDRKFSFGLVAVLRHAGYQVLAAYNGVEGLRAVRAHKPNLILCDVMMPPPNGIQLKKELAGDPQTEQIPFIFLTARTTQMDKLTGLDSGADDYITKPFDVNELLARVQAVLRRDQWARQRGYLDASAAKEMLYSSISANLSQEMRTPLTVLLTTLDLVIKEKFCANNQELADYVEKATSNAYRLKFLMDDLEMLHAMDQEGLTTFRQEIDLRYDLKHPIDQILKNWVDKSLQVQCIIHPDLIVYAPRNRFSHVVAHLVDNACKFSPENSSVQISVQPNGLGGCMFETTDQGIGIPVELRKKVFDRYFQVSQGDARRYGGLGIGLTIARAFAQAQGGDVLILDSASGCKTCLVLPPCHAD